MSEHDELVEGQEELPDPEPEVEEEEPSAEVVEEEEVEPEAEPQEELPPVDLNLASESELRQLPGIGPALAARIVNQRIEVRPFEEPADLLAVPGISQGLYDNIAARLTVTPIEPPLTSAAIELEEEVPGLKPEPEPLEEDEVLDLEPEPAVQVEEAPKPKPEPPPLVAVTEVQVAGWGRVLFVGLLSAIIGALLALVVLYGVNGTLDFQSATARVRAEAFQLEERIEELAIDLGNLQTQLNDMEDLAPVVEEARIDIQELSGDMAAAQASLDELVESVDGLRLEFTNLREDLDGMGEHVSSMDAQLGEVQAQIVAMDEQIAVVSQQVSELEQSAEKFDAFLEALRHILNESMGPPTPTAWVTPMPKPEVTVIPLATPTTSP